jgi:uncharacterized protein
MKVIVSVLLLLMGWNNSFSQNINDWEKRKKELRQCIAAKLVPENNPAANSPAIITAKRIYTNYSVENIALETVPGLYVCGSIYRPLINNKKTPAVLVPNGHFNGGRYRADVQYICASLARMGAMAISYDLFGWGESRLQVREEDHYTPTAMKIQKLNTGKILDYLFSLPQVDTSLIGITGASGGGSQTMLNTALDERIKVSVPVVMLSADYPGGCPCETGINIHQCNGGTNNAEIAAMAAPRPQLVISCGKDWTANVPKKEYPYLQKIYALYGKESLVKNVHLQNEGHDYGFSKRKAMYSFMAEYLKLNIKAIIDKKGNIDESGSVIEDEPLLLVFGEEGKKLPANALRNIREVNAALGELAMNKPIYSALPLTAIKPKGWLLQQLQTMRQGSTGHLDEIYDKLKNNNGWLGGEGDGWEETPYWLDGATPLAYLLNDTVLKIKVLKYINWTLDHQRPSGYFGPVTAAERKGAQITVDNCENGEDWWPKMIMLKVMQQYYSATNDPRVIVFMTRYFKYQLTAINKCSVGRWTSWSQARGVENIMMVNWLYTITKEKFLVDLSDILFKQSFEWSKWFAGREFLMDAALHVDDKNVMRRHSVNVAMGLKDPAINYLRTGDRKLLDAQQFAWHDLMTLHGLPAGIYSGDEDLHGSELNQGTELCTIVESMYSLEKIMEITGDTKYMDALERMTFNALPAQTTDDYNYKQYFQLPNQVQVARAALNFSVTQYNGMSNVFGTKSGYTCCYTNMHQGWTKFAAQLWHSYGDNGIATFTYAPSEITATINSADVQIEEITDYPFNDNILFKINTNRPVTFPWQFRVPGWCKKAELYINGQLIKTDTAGQIITVNRTWNNHDEIKLKLPMEIIVSNWASNSRTVERGPLVYALKIQEEWKKGHHEEAGDYFSVYPKSDWNYALLQDEMKDPGIFKITTKPLPKNFTWNINNAPIEITANGKKLPSWKLTDDSILYQPMGERSGLYQGVSEKTAQKITLIPYGFTKLRIVAFPVVK